MVRYHNIHAYNYIDNSYTHADTKAMTIPEVYHVGDCPDSSKRGIKGSFILMEYLNFDGRRSTSQRALGEALARMHLTPPSHPKAKEGYFGFDIDNTIGGTTQPNTWEEDWVNFFRTHRLKHQLDLAQDSKLSHLGKILCDNLDVFFPSEVLITPSILHGDLWSGNIASVQGKPSLFDPACYYGHHEAEFGMSWYAATRKSTSIVAILTTYCIYPAGVLDFGWNSGTHIMP